MENKIDISVIIPMYNAEKYISDAVASIVSQEAHGLKYEIIIVDDSSKDKSCEIVKSLKNDSVRLVELHKNEGTANARNTGIRLAKGEWIQFIDSDDRICQDLYRKFEMSIQPGYNCYIFSLIIDYHNYSLKQTIREVKDKRAFGHFGSVCNKFIKRDICMEFKKDFSFEDNIFIIDMMISKDLKISLISEAFYLYNRKNDDSKMAHFNQKEYRKMYSYVYSRIGQSDDFTKMYILEIFVALLFDNERPFFMSLELAAKTLVRLLKYLPVAYRNQNRHFVNNIRIIL
jgi:glycosyltransferase involved in cell wall biosynthesis